MAAPEQKQQLLDMIEGIRAKLGDANTAKFVTQNVAQQERSDAMKEALLAFQQAGIDVTNPEEINKFLEQMKAINPELAQLLEESLNSLLGDEPAGDMIQPDEALPEDVRGLAPQPPMGGAPAQM